MAGGDALEAGIEQALGSQLAFTQWLVLDATALIVRETGDAVSQSQVAQFLRLERMTLSHAMTTLSSRGLVSRGPPLSGTCWRIFVAKEGSELLCSLTKPSLPFRRASLMAVEFRRAHASPRFALKLS